MYMQCHRPACGRIQLADDYCHYCGANCLTPPVYYAGQDFPARPRMAGQDFPVRPRMVRVGGPLAKEVRTRLYAEVSGLGELDLAAVERLAAELAALEVKEEYGRLEQPLRPSDGLKGSEGAARLLLACGAVFAFVFFTAFGMVVFGVGIAVVFVLLGFLL